jgi:hypothetical protein
MRSDWSIAYTLINQTIAQPAEKSFIFYWAYDVEYYGMRNALLKKTNVESIV